jgi:hypothetical protein
MKTRVADFLMELATDPSKLDSYNCDPHRTLAAHGLRANERKALVTKNHGVVRALLQKELSSKDTSPVDAATFVVTLADGTNAVLRERR